MTLKLPLAEIVVAGWYHTLFPLPRDRSILSKSFKDHGYITHFPIVVRKITGGYEIMDGVGRYNELLKRGEKFVEVDVKEFSSERVARAFTALSNLKTSADASGLNLVQLILLGRDYARHSGERYKSKVVIDCSGKKYPSYRVANRCLNFSLAELRRKYPQWRELPDTELVAEALDPPVWQEFKKLLSGEMSIGEFDREIYKKSDYKTDQRAKQAKAIELSKQKTIKKNLVKSDSDIASLDAAVRIMPQLKLPEMLELIFAAVNQKTLTITGDQLRFIKFPPLTANQNEIKKLRFLTNLLEKTLKKQFNETNAAQQLTAFELKNK